MSARRVAFNVLLEVGAGAYANLSLKQALSKLDPREAAWVSAAVYTVLDHRMYLDYVIDHFANGRLKLQIREILRLGVCQLLYMNVPDSAACNESVQLAKEIGKGALSGYVNGIMRNICRNRDHLPPLPEDTKQRLILQYSYPEYIVEEYLFEYGEAFTEAMLSHTEGHGMTVRAQHPYTSEALEAELERRNLGYERGKLAKDAFKLTKGFDVSQEPLFFEGKIAVQSESAMLVCRALNVRPGMRVLDACAAPGGKTAYLADLMQNTGEIAAWELHEHRAELMKKTFERLGVCNAEIVVRDASEYVETYEGKFDVVLIDAPCSGLGVLGKPDARYAKSGAIIEELSKLQSAILNACCRYVKPGGVLVYATCTISKRENEAVVRRFLDSHGEFIPADLAPVVPSEMEARAKEGMIQLFPHLDGTEGFFFAKMERSAQA